MDIIYRYTRINATTLDIFMTVVSIYTIFSIVAFAPIVALD